jgi:hypothetical protein
MKTNQQMNIMKVKLQEQRNAEEQEKLRQIQLKIEAERKAREEEERIKREEEENRRKKVVIQKIIYIIKINYFKKIFSRPRWKLEGSKKKPSVCVSRRKTEERLCNFKSSSRKKL